MIIKPRHNIEVFLFTQSKWHPKSLNRVRLNSHPRLPERYQDGGKKVPEAAPMFRGLFNSPLSLKIHNQALLTIFISIFKKNPRALQWPCYCVVCCVLSWQNPLQRSFCRCQSLVKPSCRATLRETRVCPDVRPSLNEPRLLSRIDFHKGP